MAKSGYRKNGDYDMRTNRGKKMKEEHDKSMAIGTIGCMGLIAIYFVLGGIALGFTKLVDLIFHTSWYAPTLEFLF